ncbi:MAG: Nicotinamide-nucleotide amidohydrolase PncC [Verrucomicrobiae bacterium]|nr:Nicotinamide-nucleotide amidohydrolase PncC [Verrucomicrobiae bacterium]
MRIELINTGSELLLGYTVNTHANYIAGQLAERGLRLCRQTTVGDDRQEMRDAVAAALDRSDIILITGGLGPTSDDFTRDVVAELLGRQLIHHPAIAESIRDRFRRRNRQMPESVLIQALVPAGATVLENINGTAPGLFLEHAGKQIYLLPGPPRELKPMFEKLNLPRRDRLDCRVFKVARLPESIVEETVAPVLKDLPALELGYCARMGEVEVRVLGDNLDEAERRIRAALGDNIFGVAGDRLEEVVLKMMAGKTLAVAESCTGGYIAHRLTNVSGSSAVFLTGYVTYANESKMRLLGVREETLKTHGAVSEATCREMAEGARRQADYALATTGIAGPTGGTADKPVGLVFIGLATPTQTVVERHVFTFDRETFKQVVSQYALDALRRELLRS